MEMIDELIQHKVSENKLDSSKIRVGYMEPKTSNIFGFFLAGSPAYRHHMNNTKVHQTTLQVTIRGNQNDKETRELGRGLIEALDKTKGLVLPNHYIINIDNENGLVPIGRNDTNQFVYTTQFNIIHN